MLAIRALAATLSQNKSTDNSKPGRARGLQPKERLSLQLRVLAKHWGEKTEQWSKRGGPSVDTHRQIDYQYVHGCASVRVYREVSIASARLAL